MSLIREPALDEIQWRSPALVQDLGGIHTNTVHHYFMQSPFFDQTSNNAVLRTQAQYNPAMVYLLHSREAFEERLRDMQGVHFVVAEEPLRLRPEQGGDSGIWVIRKQDRRKGEGTKDVVTVLGTYFVIGENIYQAPSVGDIIGSKLLSTTTSLIKFLKNAAELPIFSPAEGYRYFHTTASKKGSKGLSQQQDQDSEMNSPGAEHSTQSNSQVPNSTASMTTAAAASSSSNNDSGLLFESFNLVQRYGTEYMDENPLQGEPGSFVFSSTNERLRARQHEQAVKAAAATAATAAAVASSSRTSESQTASAVSTPLSTIDARVSSQKGNKTVKEQATAGGTTVPPPKPKRRKSKAPVSPISPDTTDIKGIKTEA